MIPLKLYKTMQCPNLNVKLVNARYRSRGAKLPGSNGRWQLGQLPPDVLNNDFRKLTTGLAAENMPHALVKIF